jgi:hypothetical protein
MQIVGECRIEKQVRFTGKPQFRIVPDSLHRAGVWKKRFALP